MCMHQRYPLSELPIIDLYAGRELARSGDRDGAITVIRKSVDDLFTRGQTAYCVAANGVLVETQLDRSAAGDLAEAEAVIARLAAAPAEGSVIRDVWLAQLRALLAHARNDEAGYRDLRDRYRALATSLGFEGHIDWAEAMP
jgi:adenylate cyclase